MEKKIQAKINQWKNEGRSRFQQKGYLMIIDINWIIISFLNFWYILLQTTIVWAFKPTAPNDSTEAKPLGRIAVIGAGLTGVASAAHAMAHGFDVVIYEANEKLGGIWADVNSTSSLQVNSLLYRFYPSVIWSKAFPQRDEILSEIRDVWKEYGLESHTRFGTPVISIRQASSDQGQDSNDDRSNSRRQSSGWIVNEGEDGVFDAVIAAVGTCGKPRWVKYKGMPQGTTDTTCNDNTQKEEDSNHHESNVYYRGPIIHSSELDTLAKDKVKQKNVVIIGSGASAVEATEAVLQYGAAHCVVLARQDKWIIPQNILVDTFLAAQPFGMEMPLSFMWEWFIRKWHYHGVEDLVPAHKGIFEGTPVVNNVFLEHIRQRKCSYIRCDPKRFTSKGVLVNARSRLSRPGDEGKEEEVEADLIVLATGFEKPKIDFLPPSLFPEEYDRPNLYLQNFSTEDWSVLLTNSAYMNAIGTVGHFHIGIYTRILLVFLLDEESRPSPKDMKLWVDTIRYIKSGAKGGAFGFITYMELSFVLLLLGLRVIWLALFHGLRLDRIKWLFFIMNGWGGVKSMKRRPNQESTSARAGLDNTTQDKH